MTKEGKKYALKSLYIKPDRQLFIVASEQKLAEKGVELARPVPTLKGDLHMVYKKDPYILYEWIDGEGGQLRRLDDLKTMVKVMARFHHASNELEFPPGITMYSHPHWVKEYKQRIKSIKRWFTAHNASDNRKYKIICKNIPFFYRIAKKAFSALKRSGYQDYIDGRLTAKSLVHGDFHHKNLIFRGDTGVLIDFEDVRYDVPSKDLLRIFSMYTKNHPFTGNAFRSMMKTYERRNPLPDTVRQLVYIDLLFPHIFERMLRKKKYAKMDDKRLEHFIKQEKKKAEYIYRRYFKSRKPGTEGLQ